MGSLYYFIDNDKGCLGINTEKDEINFARSGFSTFSQALGWEVTGGIVHEWHPSGTKHENGKVIVYGDGSPGKALSSCIDSKDYLSALLRIGQAFDLILQHTDSLPLLDKNGIWLADSGAIIILPTTMIDRYCKPDPRFSNPRLSGEQALSFSLCSMLYEALCGKPAFAPGDTELVYLNMAKGLFLPPEAVDAGLPKRIIDCLNSCLSLKALPSLKEFLEILSLAIEYSNNKKEASKEESAKGSKARKSFERRSSYESFARRLKKSSTIIITISVIVFLGLVFYLSMAIPQIIQSQELDAMSPIELVEAYYQHFNNLEPANMTQCLSGDVDQIDLNIAEYLRVFRATMLSYEDQTSYQEFDSWKRAGQPLLGNIKFVFGIENLTVKALSSKDNSVIILATYRLWNSQSKISSKENRYILYTDRSDTLTLARNGKGYRIIDLKRIESPEVRFQGVTASPQPMDSLK